MYKVTINSDDRRGKSPDEAALLVLTQLGEIDEAQNEICIVLPAFWSWAHDFRMMQFCMFELGRKLVETVGDKFNFKCGCNEKKELSIMATRKAVGR